MRWLAEIVTISEAVTPLASLAGGGILGLASALNLWGTGRITGISGIVNTGIVNPIQENACQKAFTAGLLGGAAAVGALAPAAFGDPAGLTLAIPAVAGSGFLVGLGTQMGSGCTSGHGICGLARLSKRSFVAVGTFLTTGTATTYLANHTSLRDALFAAADGSAITLSHLSVPAAAPLVAVGAVGLLASALSKFNREREASCPDTPGALALSAGTGAAFAGGLALSGMTDANKVIAFLDVLSSTGWDPSLMLVMGGAAGVGLVLFPTILQQTLPAFSRKWRLPTISDVTPALVAGSALFGVGWGLSGVCPGPGLVGLGSGSGYFWTWVPSMLLGMGAYHRLLRPMLPPAFFEGFSRKQMEPQKQAAGERTDA